MNLLCGVSDRSIIENQSEYNSYLATLCKENYKSSFKKYTINNVNLDEVNKNIKRLYFYSKQKF